MRRIFGKKWNYSSQFINRLSGRFQLPSLNESKFSKFYYTCQPWIFLILSTTFKMSSQQICVARTTFDAIIDQYIQKHHETKRPKLFVTQDMYDEAIQILRNPENLQISNKKTRHWVNHNETILLLDVIPEKTIALREAALSQSITQFSGVRCNCKSTCLSRICACSKARVRCHSNCHPHSNKCANRH